MIEPGTILQERYLVREQIGAGGMGAVYVATDQRFNSTVAIKETFFADENLSRAFEREARLLNGLRHPALARVSDHFVDGNGQFIVMEFIDGDDLSEMMAKRGEAFPVADVLNWADQLLDALDYLHTQEMPVVHRDIKPQNLKLTSRGQIILLDFGLAKGNPANSDHQTNTKSVFGYSRIYAPLEQIQGTGTDPRSDFYSLTATVYHLMTGAPPEDALTRATAVLNGQPDPLKRPSELRPEISVAISNVLVAAMALNANYRPSSAAAMRALLLDAKDNDSAEVQQFAVPAAQIFSQDTKVIGEERAGTAPQAVFAAPTQAHSPVSNPDHAAMNIAIPQTEITRVSSLAAMPRQQLQRRRFAPVLAVFAALFGLLLLTGVAVAFYNYPNMFQPAAEPNAGQENPGASETKDAGNSALTGTAGPAGGAGSESTKDAAAAIKTEDTKAVKDAPAEKHTRDAGTGVPEDMDAAVEDAIEKTVEEDADIEGAELQRAVRNMVRKRLKDANVSDPEIEKKLKEAFDGMPEPPDNPNMRNRPRGPKVKIIRENRRNRQNRPLPPAPDQPNQ